MRQIRVWVLLAVLLQSVAQGEVIRFDRAEPGSLPAGWTIAMTHAGGAPNGRSFATKLRPDPPTVFAQISQRRNRGAIPVSHLGQRNDSQW